jgi:hypothetical protein
MDSVLSNLLSITLGNWMTLVDVPESMPPHATANVVEIARGVLAVHGPWWGRDQMEAYLRWMMQLSTPSGRSALPLVLAEHTHPGLLDSLRADPDENWKTEWRELLRAATAESLENVPIAEAAAYLHEVVPRRWPLMRGDAPFIE